MGSRQDGLRGSTWAYISHARELLSMLIMLLKYSASPTLAFYFVILREPRNLR